MKKNLLMEDYFKPYVRFAEAQGYEYGDAARSEFLWNGGDPRLYNKVCYIRNGDILFWASDSFSTKFGMTQTYSGMYRWVRFQEPDFQCRMAVRFFLDILVSGKRDKLGIPGIDQKVSLQTNNKQLASQMITEELVQNFLCLPKEVSPVEVVFGPGYVPLFRGHEDEQLVGLETKRWYTAEELEAYWRTLEEFVRQVKV